MSRSSRKAKPTPSANKHVFEPFSKRIARLKIDPVHTVRGRNAVEESSDLSQSYFRTALDEWSSLNLTTTFTSFLRRVGPLSENLPQLLFHADTVFDLLVEHIEKKDHLALEPLLDLAAHFAHDLGQEFEKYFGRIVTLVADVAASHDGADVVEWSFTCLAWMFKYLSRLLVQDLRPLLKIFRPYLSARKEHISRFSAESLAFLIRKAAIAYPKKESPLTLALNELLEDEILEQDPTQHGLKTLLVESCLGVSTQLHSGAEHLVKCLIETVASKGHSSLAKDVACGFLTGLIHDADPTSFEPVVSSIVDFSTSVVVRRDDTQVTLAADLLQTIIATRKGGRITDWHSVIAAAMSLCEATSHASKVDLLPQVQVVAASVLQYAPMDKLLPCTNRLLDVTTDRLTPAQFFSYCTLVADLGKDRFQQLMLPRLQNYVIHRFAEDESALVFALDQLHDRNVISSERKKAGFLQSTAAWDQMVCERLSTSTVLSPEILATLFRLQRDIRFPSSPEASQTITERIQRRMISSLESSGAEKEFYNRIWLGWVFEAYIAMSPARHEVGLLWDTVMPSIPLYLRLLPFVRACNSLISKYGILTDPSSVLDPRIIESVISNLLVRGQSLREQSLLLLQRLGSQAGGKWLQEVSDTLLELLRTPYLPSNARAISMLLRRLPQAQKSCPGGTGLQTLIPYFCLGMLPQYHDQCRRDLSSVLGEMVKDTSTEDTILDILTSWLRSSEDIAEDPTSQQSAIQRSSDFQDANLLAIQTAAGGICELYRNPSERMARTLEDAHQLEAFRPPPQCRFLALSTLSEMVSIVERRSRLISPIFLAAQFTRTVNEGTEQAESSDSSETLSHDMAESGWSLPSRKAFVKLISQFQNPKVLFRSAEVYDKLLELLSNGNAEIRKQALTAILKWKNSTLLKHEAVLTRMVDEKIPSTEIGVMLNTESEENPIKHEERATVLPVILRLIYGLIVGRSAGYGSQEARRKTLLRMLFRMDKSEIVIFLNISLGKLKDVKLVGPGVSTNEVLHHEVTSADQRYGFVRMMLSMATTLQSQFAPFGRHIADSVLYCTLRASLLIEGSPSGSHSIERSIRKTGLQCLTTLFRISADVNWEPLMEPLFAGIVAPRMNSFAAENSQSVSTLLRLFSVWCQTLDSAIFLTSFDKRILPAIFQTLAASTTKADVNVFILNDVLLSLLRNAKDGPPENSAKDALRQHLPILLQSMTLLLETAPQSEVLKASTAALLDLAPLARSSDGTETITTLLVNLLATSKHRLSPAVKASILAAIGALIQTGHGHMDPSTFEKLFGSVAFLFRYFKDQPNRLTLCNILQSLSKDDAHLQKASQICQDLNAVSTERLDEVDFDRRLAAFQQTSSLEISETSLNAWKPILHNLLFYCRDEDFSIRSNAVSSLRAFIKRTASDGVDEARILLKDTILPALQKGLTDDSEVVRADMVSLFGLLLQHLDDNRLNDMKSLLVGNDEEASFFTNILHIQQHRRLRALRRLEMEAEQGTISALNITQFFIPVLQKFIRDQSSDESAQTVKGQSLVVMKTLLQWVSWKQFKTIFKQYKSDLERDEPVQKTAIKMLGQAADALLEAWNQKSQLADNGGKKPPSHLAKSLTDGNTLADEVKEELLSKLADFVHYKDETEMSARLPAATIAIKLSKLLSPEDSQHVSAPVVLDVANVLKSRAQESRDAGRAVLVDIVALLGSGSLRFVLGQMRSALQRGYQLHVLSYTLHSILIALAPTLEVADLDYCTSDLTSVIMDDIFGSVGQEKDNEDYVSSMREVKSNKSFDSMELVTRCTGLDHLTLLIQPITTLLTGSLAPKQVRQVDELLRRVGIGLARHPQAGERGILVFAYQTMQNFYKEKAAPSAAVKTNDERNRERFLLQKPVGRTAASGANMLFKVARFAIDLVRSALVKHSELLSPENIHGFLPVLGDALIEGQEDVKTSSLRLLATIIKLRMPELDENGPLFVMEAVKIIRNSTHTNEEVAQAALKLVAAVLRERKSVKVRDSDVAEVLKRITPDLEEPDRQGVTFNFIRAVLARGYQLPEVYEAMDKIAIMMVTSQAHGARDVAGGVYVHFLVEYPQTSSRWTKQQKFLIKNLDYDYPEGRQSVMEAINALLSKLKGDSAQQLVSAFFVPIVLRMANDEHESCRDLAGALLGQLFLKADQVRIKGLLEPLEGWIEQEENASLVKLSLQAFGILFKVVESGHDDQLRLCRTRVAGLLQLDPTDDSERLIFEALQLLLVLVEFRPAAVLSNKADAIWISVRHLLSHSEVSTRRSAAALVNAFLGSCQPEAWTKLPLTNSHGLRWDASALQSLLKDCMRTIKTNQSDPELNQTMAEIIVLLARLGSSNGLTMPLRHHSDEPDAENSSDDDDDNDDDNDDEESQPSSQPSSIPATQYSLDQLSYILRRETPTITTLAHLPKTTALQILSTLIPHLPPTPTLTPTTLATLLLPLIHLTATSSSGANTTPYSADPTFPTTYAALTTAVQETMAALHEAVGDAAYVAAMTAASRVARERREERRRKRNIARVADPEGAARLKRRKGDRKKERRREVGRQMGGKRKARGW